MKSIKLDTKKDENGKTVFIIKGYGTVSDKEITKVKKQIDAAHDVIERMSKVNLNKLNRKFDI